MISDDPDYHYSMPSSSLIYSHYDTRSESAAKSKETVSRYVSLTKQDFYDFKVLVYYNFRRGLSEDTCFNELSLYFGSLIPQKETIKDWYNDLYLGKEIRELKLGGGRPQIRGLEARIAELLQENPYLSLKRMKKILGHDKKIIKRIITAELKMERVSTRWVPHILTPEQMETRVDLAELMKKQLLKSQKLGFSNIITGDESWFYLSYPHSSKWVASKSDRDVEQSKTHYNEKVMITICFSGAGLQHIHVLPPKTTMTGETFVNEVLIPVEKSLLSQKFPEGTMPLVHYDNARAHTCSFTSGFLSKSKLERLPHPPYSPDISPCDFFYLVT
jgi:histone-lysine N-methyltransferase SETMAR